MEFPLNHFSNYWSYDFIIFSYYFSPFILLFSLIYYILVFFLFLRLIYTWKTIIFLHFHLFYFLLFSLIFLCFHVLISGYRSTFISLMWFRSVITPYELRTDNQMNGTKEVRSIGGMDSRCSCHPAPSLRARRDERGSMRVWGRWEVNGDAMLSSPNLVSHLPHSYPPYACRLVSDA